MKLFLVVGILFLTNACYTQVGYSGRAPRTAQSRTADTIAPEEGRDTAEYEVIRSQETAPRDTVIIRERDREVWIWREDPWGRWELRRYDQHSPYWRYYSSSFRYGYRGVSYPRYWYDPWYYGRGRRDTLVIIDRDTDDESSSSSQYYSPGSGGESREPASRSSSRDSSREQPRSEPREGDTSRDVRDSRRGRGR
ncbi:hypothetical protein [Chitinivibrio alkaliphilus]|nr:hypothetical protein [Chitinivibrio alkaliphilus]